MNDETNDGSAAGGASAAQVEANRRNAQLSTGPRTQAGRARSKLNAVRHGLLGREVLLQGRHARESRRQFRALMARFWRHLAPVGPVEEMLVDQIVTAHWRLHRVLKAESGEIALSVDVGQREREQKDEHLFAFHPMASHAREAAGMLLSRSGMGGRIMAGHLENVREVVRRTGDLTEAAIATVAFRGNPYHLTGELRELRAKLLANPEGLKAQALRAWHQEQALAWLDKRIHQTYEEVDACEEREAQEEVTRQAAALLPAPEVVDKIMRYSTMLERQLFRAMEQLERVQRMRLGDQVPPPINLTVRTGE